MKRNKIIGLLLSGVIMFGVVGCSNEYRVENEDAYNKGYYKYAVTEGVDAINKDYKFYAVIWNTVDTIRVNSDKDIECNDLNGKYLYTIKEEDELDYEYGQLQFAIDRTKEEKEKDLYYIFNNGIGTLTDEVTPEQEAIIQKYNDSYVECYDELLDLLEEIKSEYGKEEISWDYCNRVNDIREKQEKILDSYAQDMMSVCGLEVLQNLFN